MAGSSTSAPTDTHMNTREQSKHYGSGQFESNDVTERSSLENRHHRPPRLGTPYEEIMGLGEGGIGGGHSALGKRLVAFRQWFENDANGTLHPHIAVVNGEATDGTKNAPVLLTAPPPLSAADASANGMVRGSSNGSASSAASGRCGMIDGEKDRALYDRTMGCQLRSTRELKKGDILLTIPRTAMITPDLVAASDAGRVAYACCEATGNGEDPNGSSFWVAFENTGILEKRCRDRSAMSSGPQLLIKILQERKKAETVGIRSLKGFDEMGEGEKREIQLCQRGSLSTRVPVLLFLIHQRFANEMAPPVVSDSEATKRELAGLSESVLELECAPGTPRSFGPYARTLPSSVTVPLCWKRNELALLAGSVPGIDPLREVAGITIQLASEFIALINAGIMHRFPSVFSRGMITWERWVWAASIFMSRVLPATCYLDEGDKTAEDHVPRDKRFFQSTPDIWNELGVMVPILDMLNHESEEAQVTWEPCKQESSTEAGADNGRKNPDPPHPPRAVLNNRVKKGNQIYTNYGVDKSNQLLITQYGFGQMFNSADTINVGWGLADAVGGVPVPTEYGYLVDTSQEGDGAKGTGSEPGTTTLSDDDFVFDSGEPPSISAWWNQSRIDLLERQALFRGTILANLKEGKKTVQVAYGDGSYHPGLLAASVVATLEKDRVEFLAANPPEDDVLGITKKQQVILRKYLAFFFTKKMEKLLHGLNNGLKDHFPNVQLWTKTTKGGLAYSSEEPEEDGIKYQGWQTFFDVHAYSTSIEVEKRYYSMAPESCVLTMYNGHLHALQASIDGLATQDKFATGILRQLQDLGFKLTSEEEEEANLTRGIEPKDEGNDSPHDDGKVDDTDKKGDGKDVDSDRKDPNKKHQRRNRGRKKNPGIGGIGGNGGDRPPAIKLHIGNLSYSTTTTDLFDYFAHHYGRENVLECHIPIERETGRSRGFGFVTLPEVVAMGILQSGRKHDVDGRLLKIAESNSAGSANRSRGTAGGPVIPSDRCARCGYRPKYCVCAVPDIPGFNGRPFVDGPRYPVQEMPRDPELDYYGASYHRRERERDSFSRSPPRRNREYDRDYRYRRTSRSRSYDRDRDRDRRRDRDRGRDRGRSRSRSRDRSREDRRRNSSGRWDGRSSRVRYSPSSSRSLSSERSREYIESRRHDRRVSEGGSADRVGGARPRSPSASPQSRSGGSTERRRSGSNRKRSRSRSRSRGRSGRRKRGSKKEGRKRARSRSRSVSGS